jgi:predicted porin
MLGGTYDAGVVKAFLTYGVASSDAVGVADRKTTSVGASAPLGGGKLLAGFASTKISGGAKRDTMTLGYDYNLSKRTDVYAMLMQDKITALTSGTSYGVGVRHRF